jgi:hypothetical protein
LLIKKILTLGIILLFISVGIQPAIAVVENNEFVEITTEICGIDGVKPHTISLSKEDAKELEQLIDDFHKELEKTETKEEAFELYNDIITELDKFGLIGDLSVKQGQELSTDNQQDINIAEIFGMPTDKSNYSEWDNTNCIVSGKVHSVLFFNPFLWYPLLFLRRHPILFDIARYIFFYAYPGGPFTSLLLFLTLGGSVIFTTLYNPIPIISGIMVGWSYGWGPYAYGPLSIAGDNGTHNFTDDYGGYISGFTGFKLYIPPNPCMFIGVARVSRILQLEE